ncbi:MAG: hypothetical protein R6X05_14545 [Desulfobacterales bacterium]|jgi:hypothetical protein
MRKMRSSPWFQLLALTGGGLLVFGAVYGLVTFLGVTEPAPGQLSNLLFRNDSDAFLPQPPAAPVPAPVEVWVLHRDRSVSIGRSRLVFRGLDDSGNLRIDAVLPELDPQRAYAHTVTRERARSGFRIANEHYRLKKIGRSALVLYRDVAP